MICFQTLGLDKALNIAIKESRVQVLPIIRLQVAAIRSLFIVRYDKTFRNYKMLVYNDEDIPEAVNLNQSRKKILCTPALMSEKKIINVIVYRTPYINRKIYF